MIKWIKRDIKDILGNIKNPRISTEYLYFIYDKFKQFVIRITVFP